MSPAPITPVLDPKASPLAAYLGATGISFRSFARALGTSDAAVRDWAEGRSIPSLATVYLIEVVTKGVVTMDSWMGMPALKAEIAARLVKMPDAVKKAILMDSGALPFEGKEIQAHGGGGVRGGGKKHLSKEEIRAGARVRDARHRAKKRAAREAAEEVPS